MLTVEAESYREWLQIVATKLLAHGQLAAPRGMSTLELRNVSAVLTTPLNRHPRLYGRNASIFALVAETNWVLAGQDDLAFIAPYLPRMAGYSDDGIVLRGAYGPRIRNWGGVDQLHSIVDTLSRDADSRRAVISLFDPARDHDQRSKDIPCTNLLNFALVEGRLDLTAYSRSMDILWGSAINFYEWTSLQEIIAHWLNVPVGKYTHFIGSLHVYDRYIARLEELRTAQIPTALPVTPFDIDRADFGNALSEYMKAELLARNGVEDSHYQHRSRWLSEGIALTRIFWSLRRGAQLSTARDLVRELEQTESTAMALDYIDRLASK